tara:strand:- start:210 stop:509 length:300 start_codon:yes stop_codon:yes gene_type:complete
MATKISYELVIEELDEYGDIIDPAFFDVERKNLNLDYIDCSFNLAIVKWSYDTERDEAGNEYIYLKKDGTFEEPLPKYIMKIIEPSINTIINHKNFKSV